MLFLCGNIGIYPSVCLFQLFIYFLPTDLNNGGLIRSGSDKKNRTELLHKIILCVFWVDSDPRGASLRLSVDGPCAYSATGSFIFVCQMPFISASLGCEFSCRLSSAGDNAERPYTTNNISRINRLAADLSSIVKVKTLFIYIADRKASAYSCRFFCSACFQIRSTTTGTLLLEIRRPRRVSGTVDHRHLHPRTHLVVQGVTKNVLQTNGRGRQTVKFVGLPKHFHTDARLDIRTRIKAIACYNLKQARYQVS